jgi:putative nucleotidyltransferase with HDIG domain
MVGIDTYTAPNESAREALLSEAGNLRLIPTLNTITSQMLEVMNDPDSSFSELFEIARHDQGFSGKIISIANSAFYSRSLKILSLQRALQVIGLEELRGILVCLTLLQDILNQWKLLQADLAAIWTHSLAVSCAARILSTRLMVEDPEEAFTVSVLHDIGKGIFYTRGDVYRNLVREARDTGTDLCRLERESFGTDHQEVGDFMALKWRLPEQIAMVIRGHHGKIDGENPLLHIVKVADAFVDNRKDDLGAEGIVLEKEKDPIIREVRRISKLVGVSVGAFFDESHSGFGCGSGGRGGV